MEVNSTNVKNVFFLNLDNSEVQCIDRVHELISNMISCMDEHKCFLVYYGDNFDEIGHLKNIDDYLLNMKNTSKIEGRDEVSIDD